MKVCCFSFPIFCYSYINMCIIYIYTCISNIYLYIHIVLLPDPNRENTLLVMIFEETLHIRKCWEYEPFRSVWINSQRHSDDFPLYSWLVNLPPLTYLRRNKGLIRPTVAIPYPP